MTIFFIIYALIGLGVTMGMITIMEEDKFSFDVIFKFISALFIGAVWPFFVAVALTNKYLNN